MKITTTKAELKAGLAITSDVAKRGVLPILSSILLEKKGDKLTFIASDSEMQVKATVPTEGNGDDFALTVVADKFTKLVSSLKDDSPVTFDIEKDKLTIKSGRSKFGLQTLQASEFPLITGGDVISSVSITQEDFKRMLKGVAASMGESDVRPFLKGVFFEIKSGTLNVVATDGFRFAMDSIEIQAPDIEKIIPRQTVIRLIKMLSDGPMQIDFYRGNVKFTIGDNEIISKLIDSRYCYYTRLIPINDQAIAVNRAALVESCNRVAVACLQKTRDIQLIIDKAMEFSCTNGIESASDSFDIDYDGERVEFGFNIDYLLDAANSFDSDSLTIRFSDGCMTPIKIEGDGNLIAVVMPMKL